MSDKSGDKSELPFENHGSEVKYVYLIYESFK
jgi:hypothetical protein